MEAKRRNAILRFINSKLSWTSNAKLKDPIVAHHANGDADSDSLQETLEDPDLLVIGLE